jgi:hypothetical protein
LHACRSTLEDPLSQLAKRRKKSVSQLIADAVDQYLQREQQSDWEERKRRALAAVGRFPAVPDLAEKHDEYYTNREDTVYKNKRD